MLRKTSEINLFDQAKENVSGRKHVYQAVSEIGNGRDRQYIGDKTVW